MLKNVGLVVPFVLLPMVGCTQLSPGAGQGADQGAIFGGEVPNEPHHAAVVSLHNRFGGNQVSRSIFCTGTLVAPDLVMTAGHCLEGNSNPAGLAVYFGDNAQQDNNPRFVFISETRIHPQYSPSPNHDVAYMRLAEPVTDVPTIPVLPNALAMQQSDVGSLEIEFVGFGRTENGTLNRKLRAFGTLGGIGFNGGNANTQISYSQQNGQGGPCNGDSGGPAFVFRGGTRYLAAVTSYGDQNCTSFGVSARLDTEVDFVADAFDGALPPGDIDDNAPPSVSILSPTSGATLPANQTIQVSATASDDFGLASVQLEWDFSDESFGCPMNDGQLSCTKSGDTYTWSIPVGTGSRTFRVKARDFVQNEVITPDRTIQLGDVTDDTAPVVTVVSPGDGQVLQENSDVQIVATATDDIALATVEIDWAFSDASFGCPMNDGAVNCTVSGNTYTWTISVGVGERPFTITATDAAGNSTTSPERTIILAEEAGPEPDPTDPDPTDPDPTDPDPVDPDPTDPVDPDPVDPDPTDPNDPKVDIDFAAALPLVCGQEESAVLGIGEVQWFLPEAQPGASLVVSVVGEDEAPIFVAVGNPDEIVIESNNNTNEKTLNFEANPDHGVRLSSDREVAYNIALTCDNGLTDRLEPTVSQGCAQTSSSSHALIFAVIALLGLAIRRRR